MKAKYLVEKSGNVVHFDHQPPKNYKTHTHTTDNILSYHQLQNGSGSVINKMITDDEKVLFH